MAIQLGFDLPVRTARGRDDFLVAPCNAIAVAMIENWQNWPGSKMVLTGPEGAGKTHLTHVWADAAQAQIISASALGNFPSWWKIGRRYRSARQCHVNWPRSLD